MLILLRIIFGALMYYAFKEAQMNAQLNPMSGDLSNAYWVAVVVILALCNAFVWAPYFGEKLADPLTGATVDAEYKESKNWLLKLIRKCEKHNMRGLAAFLCFIEGVRRPYLPTAFVIGMRNARKGSWLEKIYAKEVFKFSNAQHCLTAYNVLKAHGVDPRPHSTPGVNLVLISSEHEVKPTPPPMGVPEAPPPPKLERDPRIDIGPD
jgi:hypothetical protein